MARKLVIFFTIFIAIIQLSLSREYCKITSCGSHTLCQYKPNKVGSYCGKAKPGQLTQKQEYDILKRHNQYRQLVKDGKVKNNKSEPLPKADPSTLLPLLWDKELAAMAQAWANQCNFAHDKCRDYGPEVKESVGQNMAISYVWSDKENYDFADKNIADLVNGWFEEHQMLSISEISGYTGQGIVPVKGKTPMIGHFTQLVWGNTRMVGCGAQKYYDARSKSHSWLLVCNYNPSGNFIGHPVYTVAGSKSNPKYPKKYSG